MQQPPQSGFSLLELALVSAMLCLYMVLATPAWLEASERSRVVAGLQVAARVQQAVSEYAAVHDTLPDSNARAGVAEADSFADRTVQSVSIEDSPAPGTVRVVYRSFGSMAAGDSLLLVPTRYGNTLLWHCTSLTITASLLPANCR